MENDSDLQWLETFVRLTTGQENIDHEAISTLKSDTNNRILPEALRIFLDEQIARGMTIFKELRQNTEEDSRAMNPIGDEADQLELMGYPLPKTPMLQRDFIEIDARCEKLATLRSSGSAEELAAYERDCFTAVFATIAGYKPLEHYSSGIPDIVHTLGKYRECGTVFLQVAYWLSRLGLDARALYAEETITGDEGHRSFLARDAMEKYFVFDPAMHIPLNEISIISRAQGAVIFDCTNGEGKVRIDIPDRTLAYCERMHPHTVVQSLQSGIRDVVLSLTFEHLNLQQRQQQLTDWQRLNNTEELPHMGCEEIGMLIEAGKLQQAKQKVEKLAKAKAHCTATLRYGVDFALQLGMHAQALKLALEFEKLQRSIIAALKAAIDYRARTDCIPGGRIGPLSMRYTVLREHLVYIVAIVVSILKHASQVCDEVSAGEMQYLIGSAKQCLMTYLQSITDESRHLQERGLKLTDQELFEFMGTFQREGAALERAIRQAPA